MAPELIPMVLILKRLGSLRMSGPLSAPLQLVKVPVSKLPFVLHDSVCSVPCWPLLAAAAVRNVLRLARLAASALNCCDNCSSVMEGRTF